MNTLKKLQTLQFIAYAIALCTAAACSSGGTGGGGTAGEGGQGGMSTGQGGAGGQGGSSGTDCFTPVSTLTVNRACATDADCAMANRSIDCCGSLHTFGINTNDAADFNAAEAMCQPICDCVSKPTVADDGKVVMDPATVTVSCMNGTCMTAVP